MFRGAIRKLSLRKKLAILVSVGVFLPILALTYMQYRSLTELQNKTKGAFKDNLRQGLTLVQQQMKQRLEGVAAKTLTPIGGMRFSSEELEKHFADVKRSHPEIQEIFVLGDSSSQSNIRSVYEESQRAQSYLDDNRTYLFAHNYLFYPLKDGRHVAGVLLNERFIRDDLIPRIVTPLVASHSPTMAVTLSDENQHVLYSNGQPQNGYLLETNLDRPFSNWHAAVGLKNTNLEALAR